MENIWRIDLRLSAEEGAQPQAGLGKCSDSRKKEDELATEGREREEILGSPGGRFLIYSASPKYEEPKLCGQEAPDKKVDT